MPESDPRPPSLERLEIHKGDTLVVRYPEKLAGAAAARLHQQLLERLGRMGVAPGDVTVWVFDGGAELEVLEASPAG